MRGFGLSATLLWLAALWVALWGSVTVANVVSGLMVGALVLAFTLRPEEARDSGRTARINPIWMLVFLGHVAYHVTASNLVLAWEAVRPRDKIRTGIVAVRLRTESDIAMMAAANVVSLTPGTMLIESVGSPPVLYIHVLHLYEFEDVRQEVYRLEELAIRAFGAPEARAQLSNATQPSSTEAEQ